MTRMLRATVITAFAALAVGAPVAWAGDCANPAICQYQEQVPTSKGSKPVGTGGNKQVSKLPTSVEHSIQTQSGSDATALVRIATTSGAGAPQKIMVKKSEQKRLHRQLKKANVDQSKPVRAGFSTVSGSGNGRLLALVIVMAAMTLTALALAVVRRRSAGASRR
jgi:hypothetical protein